jgi:hypothetical protein
MLSDQLPALFLIYFAQAACSWPEEVRDRGRNLHAGGQRDWAERVVRRHRGLMSKKQKKTRKTRPPGL